MRRVGRPTDEQLMAAMGREWLSVIVIRGRSEPQGEALAVAFALRRLSDAGAIERSTKPIAGIELSIELYRLLG